jgi:hypothetical protein
MMLKYFPAALALLVMAILVWQSPAAAQCSGSMMGGCSGSENCHDPGEECTAQNCPEGMMGSCMEDSTCMGECHEGGGSPCPMEECPMENCPMPEMCEMMGMMGGCEEMMGGCCDMGTTAAHRRIQMRSNPNPFNPTTSLSFALQEAMHVDLRIYDISAREVALLAHGTLEAGSHTVAFSAENLPAGIYLARLITPGAVSLQKLVLLK